MVNNFIGLMFAVGFVCTLSACDDAPLVSEASGTRVEIATPAAHAVADSSTAAQRGDRGASALEGKVQLAAVLAREISAAPERSSKILRSHGLDRNKLDTLMFEIAGDPELTRAYLAARRSR